MEKISGTKKYFKKLKKISALKIFWEIENKYLAQKYLCEVAANNKIPFNALLDYQLTKGGGGGKGTKIGGGGGGSRKTRRRGSRKRRRRGRRRRRRRRRRRNGGEGRHN